MASDLTVSNANNWDTAELLDFGLPDGTKIQSEGDLLIMVNGVFEKRIPFQMQTMKDVSAGDIKGQLRVHSW